MKLALQPLGKLSFDGRRPLFELRRFRAEITERMLPGIVGLIPARFQIGAAHASLIEIALQRFDLAHRLQISVLELLDLLACGIDFFPRRGVLLLVFHLHQLALIAFQDFLMIGELAFDAPPLFR